MERQWRTRGPISTVLLLIGKGKPRDQVNEQKKKTNLELAISTNAVFHFRGPSLAELHNQEGERTHDILDGLNKNTLFTTRKAHHTQQTHPDRRGKLEYCRLLPTSEKKVRPMPSSF